MASVPCMLAILLVIMAEWGGVAGKTWTVGDTQGWSAIDYSAWLRGKVFTVGDELVFPYSQGAQDVAEVSQEDYEACNGRNPLNKWINGNTHVTLTTPGTKYYICTFPGHCPPLQLAINVVMSANSTTIPTNQAATDVNTIAASQRKTPPPPYNNNNYNSTPKFNSAPFLHCPFLSLVFVAIVLALLT